MSDELDIQVTFNYEKSGLVIDRNMQDTFTVSGTPVTGGVQSVGTSAEAIAINDLSTTKGYAYFKNLDATNYVTIGTYVTSTYYPAIKLKAGEFCLFRLSPALVYYALADTAGIALEYQIISD